MAEDFTEQLNAILGNPDAMGKIMSIARSITGKEQARPAPDGAPATGPALEPAADPECDLAAALSDLDPRLIQMGARLYSAWSRPDDSRAVLLSALRPFVKEERFERLDQAIQIARLSRVIREAFRLFREGEGGGEDV